MEASVNITNAKVWHRREILEAGISITDDRIAKLGKDSSLPRAERELDVGGRLVLPGLIDVHCHLRDFELSYKEDFSSGTASAVTGGFTTLLDMPNTKPPTTTPESIRTKIRRMKGKLFCDVGFYATPKNPEQVGSLLDSGCMAIKIYMARSLDGETYSTEEEIYKLIRETSSQGVVLSVHAEDPTMIGRLGEDLSPYLHARFHPIKAEERAIEMALSATKRAHGRLHVCHVSTLEGVRKIIRAKRDGIDVTCEATPHHTAITKDVFKRFGKMAVVEPPLRSKRHVEAVLKSISNGDVDILATDHAPHTLEEKERSYPGFPGFEIAVPVFFTLVKDGLLPLDRVVDALTTRPARRFSLYDAGIIDVGRTANLTVIDLKKEKRIDQNRFFSKAKFSPFNGMLVKAGVYATFVRGREVFLDGEIVSSTRVGKVIHGQIRR
ncbi:MAG: dihydroorotase [Nitrososphaerales archaeon]